MIELRKRIVRRLENGLVVEIDRRGVWLRKYRGRKRWLGGTWEQVAALTTKQNSLMSVAEMTAGLRAISALLGPGKNPSES